MVENHAKAARDELEPLVEKTGYKKSLIRIILIRLIVEFSFVKKKKNGSDLLSRALAQYHQR